MGHLEVRMCLLVNTRTHTHTRMHTHSHNHTGLGVDWGAVMEVERSNIEAGMG